MPWALHSDVRKRATKAFENGFSPRQVASQFDIGISTTVVWARRLRETGKCDARRQGRKKGSVLDQHGEYLLGLMEAKADTTLEEIRERLQADRGATASVSTIWRFFKKHRITFKKKTGHAKEQERPDVLARRLEWGLEMQRFDAGRLVFLDETGLNTKMARLRGWSPRGERCHGPPPFGSRNATTFIGAMRLDDKIVPGMVEGPVNGGIPIAHIMEFPAPTLRPGDIVIMDNQIHAAQRSTRLPGNQRIVKIKLPGKGGRIPGARLPDPTIFPGDDGILRFSSRIPPRSDEFPAHGLPIPLFFLHSMNNSRLPKKICCCPLTARFLFANGLSECRRSPKAAEAGNRILTSGG